MLLYPNLTPHSPAPRCTLARRSRAQTDRQPDRQSRGHLLQLLIRAAAPPAAAAAAAAAAEAAAAAVAALDGGVPLRQLHHLRLYIAWCNKYNGTIRRIKQPLMRVSRSGSSTSCAQGNLGEMKAQTALDAGVSTKQTANNSTALHIFHRAQGNLGEMKRTRPCPPHLIRYPRRALATMYYSWPLPE